MPQSFPIPDFSMPSRPSSSVEHRLTPDIPGVQTSRHGSVGCSLDNGAAVGKQCDLVRLARELKDKVVVADNPVGLQAQRDFRKIYRPFPLVNLH
jgi:hypothetical protein